MLQQLSSNNYFGIKYLSLAAKRNFKTMHHSIEKNYSCDDSVLHGIYCTFIQIQNCN